MVCQSGLISDEVGEPAERSFGLGPLDVSFDRRLAQDPAPKIAGARSMTMNRFGSICMMASPRFAKPSRLCPQIAAPSGKITRQHSIKRQKGAVRRSISVVHGEGPTHAFGKCSEICPVVLYLLLIGLA